MSSAVSVPPAPRLVPWRAVWSRHWWLAALGLLLCASGVVWAIGSGTRLAAVLADPGIAVEPGELAPIGWLVLPGLFLGVAWLRSVLRWRLLLSQGRVIRAEMTFYGQFGWALGHLHVGFRYRDANAQVHEQRQWVPQASWEGQRVLAGGDDLCAVLDDARPASGCLVAAERLHCCTR